MGQKISESLIKVPASAEKRLSWLRWLAENHIYNALTHIFHESFMRWNWKKVLSGLHRHIPNKFFLSVWIIYAIVYTIFIVRIRLFSFSPALHLIEKILNVDGLIRENPFVLFWEIDFRQKEQLQTRNFLFDRINFPSTTNFKFKWKQNRTRDPLTDGISCDH